MAGEISGAVFCSRSWEDTFDFARGMAQNARPGDIICLTGDLGSGKTVFAKGFAAGLGIAREAVSPTFTILIEYPVDQGKGGAQRLPLYHFDVYRLGETREDFSGAASGAGNKGGKAGSEGCDGKVGSESGAGNEGYDGGTGSKGCNEAGNESVGARNKGCGEAGSESCDAGASLAVYSAVSQFEDIGGDEYLFGDGVCLIEWAELIKPAIPEGAVWVEIRRTGGDEDERQILTFR